MCVCICVKCIEWDMMYRWCFEKGSKLVCTQCVIQHFKSNDMKFIRYIYICVCVYVWNVLNDIRCIDDAVKKENVCMYPMSYSAFQMKWHEIH